MAFGNPKNVRLLKSGDARRAPFFNSPSDKIWQNLFETSRKWNTFSTYPTYPKIPLNPVVFHYHLTSSLHKPLTLRPETPSNPGVRGLESELVRW